MNSSATLRHHALVKPGLPRSSNERAPSAASSGLVADGLDANGADVDGPTAKAASGPGPSGSLGKLPSLYAAWTAAFMSTAVIPVAFSTAAADSDAATVADTPSREGAAVDESESCMHSVPDRSSALVMAVAVEGADEGPSECAVDGSRRGRRGAHANPTPPTTPRCHGVESVFHVRPP